MTSRGVTDSAASPQHTISFHAVTGPNVSRSPDPAVAIRHTGKTCRAYVFSQRPIRLGEKFTVKLFSEFERKNANFLPGLTFGMTSCDPGDINAQELPEDADNLVDRKEYWVVRKDIVRDPAVNSELTFYASDTGEILLLGGHGQTPATLFYIDKSVPMWAFFDLFGCVNKIQIGGVSPHVTASKTGLHTQSSSPALISPSPGRRPPSNPPPPPSSPSPPSSGPTAPPSGRIPLPSSPSERPQRALSHPSLSDFARQLEMAVSMRQSAASPHAGTPHVNTAVLTPRVNAPLAVSPVGERAHSATDRNSADVIKLRRPAPPPPIPPRRESLANNVPEASHRAHSRPNAGNRKADVGGKTGDLDSTGSRARTAKKDSAGGKDEAANGASECVICLDRAASCVLYMCGHMCACYECAKEMQAKRKDPTCPLCREPIKDVIRVYRT